MNTQIPILLSITFLVAFCFPIYMIASLTRRHVSGKRSITIFWMIIVLYGLYLAVVAYASINGAFSENTLPPKIVKLTTIPLLLFYLGIVFNTKWYRMLLKSIPVKEFILLHRFRLIGSFFLVLLLLGFLPPVFALIAGLGDIITAISSIWIAKLLKEGRTKAHSWALVWNSFGFLDILITSTTAVLLTKISIETGALGVEVLTVFPFCFIPAFAPATIIFLHITIYRKLLVEKFR
ncbi:MAG: hypothetical protein AAF789_01370 [Bacteroidota bacterium]